MSVKVRNLNCVKINIYNLYTFLKKCPHKNIRHRRIPHGKWGQVSLMLFLLFSLQFARKSSQKRNGATHPILLRREVDFLEVKIRNLSAATVRHLDELAHKKGISRNELLREYLDQLAMMDGLIQLENKYEQLVGGITEILHETNRALEQSAQTNQLVLEEMLKRG